jgi:two-component system NarL family response regulator
VSDAIRVLIVEDHPLMATGLKATLGVRPGLQIVGVAANGGSALRLVNEARPDVVLMDIKLPGVDGLEITRRIRKENAGIAIVILTSFEEHDLMVEAFRAGASAYALKDVEPDELERIVRVVAGGRNVLMPPGMAEVLAHPERVAGPLTAREFDALRLIALGKTNREIADELGVTEGTVKSHVTSILNKLGVPDRTRAVLEATRRGWLKLAKPDEREA